MRIVAAKAVPRARTGDAMARLLPLLEDERVEVRHAAIASLTVLPGDRGRDFIEKIMAGHDREAKAILLAKLSGRNDPWVLDLYEQALKEQDPVLWSEALKGLPAFHSARAANLIGDFLLEHGFDTEPAKEAIAALKEMGGKEARDTALALMDHCPDKEMRHRVIFALADLGDTRIFPSLADCMLVESLRQRALDAMAFLVVADFGEENWKYRELWEKFPNEDQAYFLKHALKLTELETSREKQWEGIPLSELVKALRNETWPVRNAALRILEEGADRSFGALQKDSPAEEVNQVAKAWESWLATE
jgi:HEAT repeat protein